jgi:diguanylate cyclase (GGDEF)-like protein
VSYQLRDQHGASRAVAYLMMTASPFIFVTFLLVPGQPVSHLVAVVVTCVVLAAGGVFARFRPDRMPRWFWFVAPFFAIMVVTGMNLVTEDASTGAQLFYLWPVLYSANFLSRRIVYITMAGVSLTEASVVFPLLPTIGDAASDWVSMTVAMTLIAIVVLTLRDRSDRLREVLETQALVDSLTGLANRRSFDAELGRTVAWSCATGEPVALITIDVDHFKKINDTWGHAVGDKALQLVAGALRGVAGGEDDVVARLGGDEFVVLLRADRLTARRTADEARAAAETIDGLPGGAPQLSIGVAILPDHASSAEELIGAADAALYEAKSGGRGRTAMAHPPAPRHNVDRLVTEEPAVRH